MRTPYVPHFFGDAAWERVKKQHGWLIAAVATSIPWPQDDVLLVYDGVEYFLLGAIHNKEPASPCVATPCPTEDYDGALAHILRFVSVLGWFKKGYVDVAMFGWGNRPHRMGHQRLSYADVLQGGKNGFDCNYMPVIEDDRVRKALAFWREGQRLRRVHDAYAFLSFFKVVESQFDAPRRVSWIDASLPLLGGEAAKRVAELRVEGVDVNKHIFSSGRCAVAHASIDGAIVDPDIPVDRRRIRDDLVLVEALARRFLEVDAGVPDEAVLYATRDRLVPWHALLAPDGLARLRQGQRIEQPEELGKLEGAVASVRLWPSDPTPAFKSLELRGLESGPGWVKFTATNKAQTIKLVFAMDVANGRMHPRLEEWALADNDPALTESDVESFTYLFHSVVGNGLVELAVDGADPVPCEIVIPVNIMPRAPAEAAAEAVAWFRKSRGADVPAA